MHQMPSVPSSNSLSLSFFLHVYVCVWVGGSSKVEWSIVQEREVQNFVGLGSVGQGNTFQRRTLKQIRDGKVGQMGGAPCLRWESYTGRGWAGRMGVQTIHGFSCPPPSLATQLSISLFRPLPVLTASHDGHCPSDCALAAPGVSLDPQQVTSILGDRAAAPLATTYTKEEPEDHWLTGHPTCLPRTRHCFGHGEWL